MTSLEPPMVQIKLIPAQTADERKRNIVANIVVEGNSSSVPYIDEAAVPVAETTLYPSRTGKGVTSKTPLRYYAVGPSTYKIRCPLCEKHGDAAVVRAAGCKDLNCCLSMLSCVFPIFWLCCICTWCGCNREWTTKGVYCNQCGAKLGIQRKAK